MPSRSPSVAFSSASPVQWRVAQSRPPCTPHPASYCRRIFSFRNRRSLVRAARTTQPALRCGSTLPLRSAPAPPTRAPPARRPLRLRSVTQPLKPRGFLTITLHAHLPYVVNHGTWPHGIEWLLEAAAETYLPLLRVFDRLDRDNIPLNLNLNLSPILLEQLAHPVFRAEFPRYLERKITAAREDESFFLSMGEHTYAETARFWQSFFSDALQQFEAHNRDIIAGFRRFADRGMIEIITCAATHGYMPLLGTDESLRAQIRVAVATHEKHLGQRPRGIWAPECGYRPA